MTTSSSPGTVWASGSLCILRVAARPPRTFADHFVLTDHHLPIAPPFSTKAAALDYVRAEGLTERCGQVISTEKTA